MVPLSRRYFIQLSADLCAAAALGSARLNPPLPPIGAQLYTVRKEASDDLPGTLARLKKIGFGMVESFPGVYSRPAKELRSMVEDAGLDLPSGHFAYDSLETQLDYAHELGVHYMVCAMLPKPLWTRDGFKSAAEEFNKAGARAKDATIKLCFHNHNFEFEPLSPGAPASTPQLPDMGLKILLADTRPDLVGWEEDCYWVAQAGQDPLVLLRQYDDRTPLLHLKDRKPEAAKTYTQGKQSQFFTEIGAGTIDWGPIVQMAISKGKLMFIEQDTTEIPAMDSLALSYKNLQQYL